MPMVNISMKIYLFMQVSDSFILCFGHKKCGCNSLYVNYHLQTVCINLTFKRKVHKMHTDPWIPHPGLNSENVAYCHSLDWKGKLFEPPHDKTNKMACAPGEDSDQPGHLPSLIKVFAISMKKDWVLSYPLSAQRRLWSDWADLRLIWVFAGRTDHFVGFVMRRLISCFFFQLSVI